MGTSEINDTWKALNNQIRYINFIIQIGDLWKWLQSFKIRM